MQIHKLFKPPLAIHTERLHKLTKHSGFLFAISHCMDICGEHIRDNGDWMVKNKNLPQEQHVKHLLWYILPIAWQALVAPMTWSPQLKHCPTAPN